MLWFVSGELRGIFHEWVAIGDWSATCHTIKWLAVSCNSSGSTQKTAHLFSYFSQYLFLSQIYFTIDWASKNAKLPCRKSTYPSPPDSTSIEDRLLPEISTSITSVELEAAEAPPCPANAVKSFSQEHFEIQQLKYATRNGDEKLNGVFMSVKR